MTILSWQVDLIFENITYLIHAIIVAEPNLMKNGNTMRAS